MRYLCLVYHEQTQLEALPASAYAALVGEVLDYRERLQQSGHSIASGALQPAQMATTIRVWNGTVSIAAGPPAEARGQLGEFYLIDARDLNDAIRLAARMPLARLGWIEIRPIKQLAAPEG